MKRPTVAAALCLVALALHADDKKAPAKPVLGRGNAAAAATAPVPPKPTTAFAGRALADSDAATQALVERAVAGLGGSDAITRLKGIQRVGSRFEKADPEQMKAQERKRNRAIASTEETKKIGDRTYASETIIQFPDLMAERLAHPDLNIRVVLNPEAAFMYHSQLEVTGVALRFHQDDREELQHYFDLLPIVALRRRTTNAYRFHNAGPVKVNGHACTLLEIGVDGRTDQWSVEDQTGHILRIVSSASDDNVVEYDDFRTVDGLTFPYRETTLEKGELHAREQTRQYNLNKLFPKDVFRTPLASVWYRKIDKKDKK
jgi:hypothetical protein